MKQPTYLRTAVVLLLFRWWTAPEASPALLLEQFGVGLHSRERLTAPVGSVTHLACVSEKGAALSHERAERVKPEPVSIDRVQASI
ncbi:hypothetical protein EYF80_021099 [Liparis tanakae]|uniref:Uncharacterized protein n=1 Tax=Liparis tanakae TaxID=230148 RepID=A0A4Z2HSR0_9TELE|nr:hypothetical protein EYF80_021099 [Liparis tanakae]